MADITLKTGNTPASEYSKTFLQGMVDRMGVSFHKYGAVKLAYPKDVDAVRSLQQRLDRYHETGNTEWLMDVANFAMIEFMLPRHPEAHFEPTDSKDSPGRTRTDGRLSGQKHNLDIEVQHADEDDGYVPFQGELGPIDISLEPPAAAGVRDADETGSVEDALHTAYAAEEQALD